jgi:3-oxoadipate enol-lactonase
MPPHKGPLGFCPTENERIYYETYGQGEAVVFCHGLGGNHAIWYQQVPEFAQTYRVVTWDQRGFGRSTNVARQHGPVSAARDLTALLDRLNIDRAHLIGQSMGGWAVLGFVLAHPQRIRTLTLADTIAGIYTPPIRAAYAAYNRARASAPPLQELPLGEHPAIGRQLSQQNLAQAFLYTQIGSVASPPPSDILALLQNTAYPHEAIGQLNLPTLFVVGSHDPIFPPDVIREAASLIPHSRVVEIPNTGHSPYFEAPALWNEAVLTFLQA